MLTKIFISLVLFLTLLLRLEAQQQSLSTSTSMSMTGSMSTATVSMSLSPSISFSPSYSASLICRLAAVTNIMNTCPQINTKICLKWTDAPGVLPDIYNFSISWGTPKFIFLFNITRGFINNSNVNIINLPPATTFTIGLQSFIYMNHNISSNIVACGAFTPSVTFTTAAATACDNRQQGVTNYMIQTLPNTGIYSDVKVSWTNGVIPYSHIQIKAECQKIKVKNGVKSYKMEMFDYFLPTRGLSSFFLRRRYPVQNCRLTLAKTYYADGCCEGCRGGHIKKKNQ